MDTESVTTQQQTDWSSVHECFDKPHLLLGSGISKNLQDMVKGAMGEMRRYYSRKIVDVLVRVTRQSLDALRKRFSNSGNYSTTSETTKSAFFFFAEESEESSVFILHSVLMIPKVTIQPTLDEVQDVLIRAGKTITGVAKGVGQWTAGRPQVCIHFDVFL